MAAKVEYIYLVTFEPNDKFSKVYNHKFGRTAQKNPLTRLNQYGKPKDDYPAIISAVLAKVENNQEVEALMMQYRDQMVARNLDKLDTHNTNEAFCTDDEKISTQMLKAFIKTMKKYACHVGKNPDSRTFDYIPRQRTDKLLMYTRKSYGLLDPMSFKSRYVPFLQCNCGLNLDSDLDCDLDEVNVPIPTATTAVDPNLIVLTEAEYTALMNILKRAIVR